jgi:hypothetical protein
VIERHFGKEAVQYVEDDDLARMSLGVPLDVGEDLITMRTVGKLEVYVPVSFVAELWKGRRWAVGALTSERARRGNGNRAGNNRRSHNEPRKNALHADPLPLGSRD